jgi:hypothetical protein
MYASARLLAAKRRSSSGASNGDAGSCLVDCNCLHLFGDIETAFTKPLQNLSGLFADFGGQPESREGNFLVVLLLRVCKLACLAT